MSPPRRVCKGRLSEAWDVGGGSRPRAVLVVALRVPQYSDVLGTADFRVPLTFLSSNTPYAASTTPPGPCAQKLGLIHVLLPC